MLTNFRKDHNPAESLPRALALTAATLMGAMLLPAVCAAQEASANASSFVSVVDPAMSGGLASVSHIASAAKTLHLTVGHSMFLDTKSRLHRVYVADPAVLTSVTLNPNRLMVTAMTPGLSSLTVLDEFGQAQSFVVSSDPDLDALRATIADALRSNSVKVEGSGGRVTLSGTVPTQEAADTAVKLAGLYSKDVANAIVISANHPKQVRLQVRILEVDRSKLLQLGVNLFSPGGNSNFLASSTSAQFGSSATLSQSGSGSTGASLLTTTNPLDFLLYSYKLNVGATIKDLQTKQVLQILAEPTITTVSGEKANFLSGGEFPFPVVQPGGTGASPVVTIQFRPFGVKLEFTPYVNDDGTIRLKVSPEVSALDYSNAVVVSGFTIPALSTRRADTEVELRSNQSFAISGLLDQRTTDIMSKNPGAANIPVLGYLFKSKNTNHATTELVVVVTPTVVDPLTQDTKPMQPQLPIAPLDTGNFDHSLGRDLSPNPGPPALHPDQQKYGNEFVPGGASAPATVPAGGEGTSGPAAAAQPQSAPVNAPASTSAAPAGPSPTQAPAPAPKVAPTTSTPAPAAKSGAGVNPAALAAFLNPDAQQQAPATKAKQVRTATSKSVKPALVEITAVSQESDAEAMVNALKRRGYSVAVNQDPKDKLLHLEMGPFSSKTDAEQMRQRLMVDGYNARIK